jgi:hypothetical protein
MTRSLALEVAPLRANSIAAGVVGPADIAALAVHLMTNTATFDCKSPRTVRSDKFKFFFPERTVVPLPPHQ